MSASLTSPAGGQDGSRPSLSLRTFLMRPEFTAVVGTIVVFAFFAIFTGSAGFLTVAMTRNYLEVAAEIGIIAAPITLLLVAGEFDLSVGSMVAASEVIISYLTVDAGWSLPAALGAAVVAAAAVGTINGYLVVRTKLPSFIITLAMLFIVRGAAQGVLRMLTGTSTIDGVREAVGAAPSALLFSSTVGPLSISVVWWIAITLLAAWVLDGRVFGNWIYATGGNQAAAVRTGIPVNRVKILLYVAVAVSTTLVAVLDLYAINQGSANAATGREFEVVTAAVIGGALLTGGYGSPIGTLFGALLFGMVDQGFFFTPLPDVWFMTFLGLMLLLAVFINNYTRMQALKPRGRS
ncbi:ABC transporter permease [Lichenibacterium ramalinae]|uniref:Xylose transport system permease protein XylH n=1 Tax=Lichenibacterium ramalinae TaxID=2316527 RepID=A0A4Q2RA02_9HYPH|nr:ABC transporter permease [Lichenibacterium ramalinae]